MAKTNIQPGAGARTARVAKRGSLREALYEFYRNNPGAMMGRQEAAERFGNTIKAVDRVTKELRDEGLIVPVFGYVLAEQVVSLPTKAPMRPKPPRAPSVKAELPAEWPRRPVPNSVFQLAQTL